MHLSAVVLTILLAYWLLDGKPTVYEKLRERAIYELTIGEPK